VRVTVCASPRCRVSPGEYEDATSPDCSQESEWVDGLLRFAIADGATSSSFAQAWAQLLVQGWTAGLVQPDGAGIASLAQSWRAAIDLDGLSWFAADKARVGSHAAFVGLELSNLGRFRLVSMGDCCFFLVRDDTLIESFPVRHRDDLDGRPALIGTGTTAAEFRRCARLSEGWWQPGDVLLLMSDALARWFLDAALVRQSAPWRVLAATCLHQESFDGLVSRLRETGALQPDDVTLMSIAP
jgi:hypothetical protein